MYLEEEEAETVGTLMGLSRRLKEYNKEFYMATFSGDAAGYRVDFLANGKIRVVDIDVSDGDTGKHIVSSSDGVLNFDDRSYGIAPFTDIRVNTTTASAQWKPAITTLADGGYVITWYSYDALGGGDSDSDGIYAQRYDAAGNAVGGEMRINTTMVAAQTDPETRFSVATTVVWGFDEISEWFPAIADRQSVATVQGSEWLGADVES